MLGKRKHSKSIAPVKKRRKGDLAIEEIVFDTDARHEYLTGFHKRKLQRIKHAKDEALKKERVERLASRKALREERRADLIARVKAVNSAVRKTEGLEGSGSATQDEENPFEAPRYGSVQLEEVDREDDYMDEDRYTTVTVEAVNISREGFSKAKPGSGDEDETSSRPENRNNGRKNDMTKDAKDPERRQARIKKKPDKRSKRKKFRYENKAERKVTRYKERSSGKAKAKARKA